MLALKKNKKLVLCFILPPLIFYILLLIFPVLETFFLSFFKWKGVGGSQFKFVGMHNYIKVFGSMAFWKSLGRLLYFVVLSLAIQLVFGFILAYLISLGLKGTKFFKLAFFLPVVLSITAVALMWRMILSTNDGMLNALLTSVGLGALARSWLTDPKICFTVITLINSWVQIGVSFVILLAGICAIPEDLYEAAAIDGISGMGRIFKITIPLLKDVIGVCAVLIITNSMKTFEVFYVITSGSFGPGDANMVPMGLMYNTAFQGNDFGRGSVMALTIMIIGAVISGFVYFRGFNQNENEEA